MLVVRRGKLFFASIHHLILISGNNYADVFDCKRMIDGSVLIEGEQRPLSLEDLQSHVSIIGRAVWTGMSL